MKKGASAFFRPIDQNLISLSLQKFIMQPCEENKTNHQQREIVLISIT